MIEKRIDRSFQNLFEKYGYSKEASSNKNIFEKLEECDKNVKQIKKDKAEFAQHMNAWGLDYDSETGDKKMYHPWDEKNPNFESLNEDTTLKDLANKALKIIKKGKEYEVVDSTGNVIKSFDNASEATEFAKNRSRWDRDGEIKVKSYDRAEQNQLNKNHKKDLINYKKTAPEQPEDWTDLNTTADYFQAKDSFDNNLPEAKDAKRKTGTSFENGHKLSYKKIESLSEGIDSRADVIIIKTEPGRGTVAKAQQLLKDAGISFEMSSLDRLLNNSELPTCNESMFGGKPLSKEELVRNLGGIEESLNESMFGGKPLSKEELVLNLGGFDESLNEGAWGDYLDNASTNARNLEREARKLYNRSNILNNTADRLSVTNPERSALHDRARDYSIQSRDMYDKSDKYHRNFVNNAGYSRSDASNTLRALSLKKAAGKKITKKEQELADAIRRKAAWAKQDFNSTHGNTPFSWENSHIRVHDEPEYFTRALSRLNSDYSY